jgi:alpha-ketoglutarate-dependent taurine dioxygenase
MNNSGPPFLVADVRSWQAGTIDDPRAWDYPLSAGGLAALDQTLAEVRRHRPVTAIQAGADLRAACEADFQPVLHSLERGRGFAMVTGLPPERYFAADLQILYWLVGQLLGRPAEQNTQGTLLYDVRDTGQDVRSGARFSVTNAESSFHTDNSFGSEVVDYVGLLCLQTARAGGRSQVVSGHAVYRRLLERHPDVLESLGRPFHIDRRGGVAPGEGPTAQFPIVQVDGPELIFRYLRFWIEAGHEKAGKPLTPAQVRALNVLDAVLADPEFRVEFPLNPGEMFFINNRWILHNRTAFEDHPEPQRRRHLVRLWLRATSAARG